VAHPFVVLGAMAAATSRVGLMTAVANNLMRSPVEAAQAAITLNEVSAGRFVLGFGAGWARHELEAAGIPFPSPRERAERYVSALRIVRDLFASGRAIGDGAYDGVDIDLGGPPAAPPPLVGAVAGRWVTRHVAPLVDRVDVLPFPRTSNRGALLAGEVANVERDAIRRAVDEVKQHAPATPVSVVLFVAIGTIDELRPLQPMFASPFASGLCGRAEIVATTLQQLADIGLDQVTLIPLVPDREAELAAELFR
jgi:alkanesulfonate monooxygenase SsuD/methylene tetrahydromethanopterin reductase-like flavin-dependent oxidoreductase (luciferase family)